jgi:hypothetical protein
MHLLYLDDSGSVDNKNENYIVLGGVCVSEAQVHWVTTQLDRIAERLRPTDPDAVEFHASAIFSGREEPWKSLTKVQRQDVIKEVLGVLTNSYETARAFATVVHKPTCKGRDPMEVAFEDVCSRFDKFLCRSEVDSRGLIILDESAHATRLEQLARQFRKLGTSWNSIRRIVDGPLFVSSRSFRCVQLADHIAYAVFRRYEAKDTNYFDVFAHRFDRVGPTIHGLRHVEPDASTSCLCPACLSRVVGRQVGRLNGADKA